MIGCCGCVVISFSCPLPAVTLALLELVAVLPCSSSLLKPHPLAFWISSCAEFQTGGHTEFLYPAPYPTGEVHLARIEEIFRNGEMASRSPGCFGRGVLRNCTKFERQEIQAASQLALELGINAAHDPALLSWVLAANQPEAGFPIQNLPPGSGAGGAGMTGTTEGISLVGLLDKVTLLRFRAGRYHPL